MKHKAVDVKHDCYLMVLSKGLLEFLDNIVNVILEKVFEVSCIFVLVATTFDILTTILMVSPD